MYSALVLCLHGSRKEVINPCFSTNNNLVENIRWFSPQSSKNSHSFRTCFKGAASIRVTHLALTFNRLRWLWRITWKMDTDNWVISANIFYVYSGIFEHKFLNFFHIFISSGTNRILYLSILNSLIIFEWQNGVLATISLWMIFKNNFPLFIIILTQRFYLIVFHQGLLMIIIK